ncbi:MAG: hypothetical protein RBG13Loki_4170 [Promethearchaeota archaeon CR_4]|nr:MAG: hypothetical protein RBG13Loki_4170 [Candidatus Lokiarchaeota archaeon CR_4]
MSLSGITYTQNRIVLPNAYVAGNYIMDLTYEIFENSIFTKVTCSVKSLGLSGALQIRYYGDRDGINWHRDGAGNSYQGDLSSMPTITTDDWTACWAYSRTDLLGFVVSPYQQITTDDWDSFNIQGDITLTGSGSYQEFSFYVVTSAKGSPEETPVKNVWEDLINTPKLYSFSPAEKKQATIYLTIIDHDGFPLPGARVYLNASTNWAQWNDSKTTNDQGQCVFSNKQPGYYNFSVNISAPLQNKTLQTNVTSQTINCNAVNNYLTIKTQAYRITFDVKDKDNHPLPNQAWVSVGVNGVGFVNNVTLNTTGGGIFRWINGTDYNYTLYYKDPLYNNGVEISLESGTVLWSGHVNGTSQTKSIPVEMTSVNFTVTDTNGMPVIGAVLKVCNTTDSSGPIDPEYPLTNLTATDTEGKTQFYWRTKIAWENYSFYLQLGNVNQKINVTDGGGSWGDYQNFTMTNSIKKDVIVNTDTSKFLGKIVPVNDAYWRVYLNESLAVQVVYQHIPGDEGSYRYASASTMKYTLKNSLQQVLAGSTGMAPTIQIGRYQASLDMSLLGMKADETYSLLIEATEAGYSYITPFQYSIDVMPIPTEFTSDGTTFSARWGDVNSTNLQLDALYPEVMTTNYVVTNTTQWVDADFSSYVPFVENEWNLTRVDFVFNNYTKSGANVIFQVYDDPAKTTLVGSNTTTNPSFTLLTIYGQWRDDDLTFFIDSAGCVGDSYSFTAKGYYQRTGVVRNQTITNIQISAGGSTTVECDSPGNGWIIKSMQLDFEGIGAFPSYFNLTWWDGQVKTITSAHQTYTGLNWYLNPETDSIAFMFNSSSAITFNVNISLTLEQVTDKHPYAETDEITFSFNVVNDADFEFELSNAASKSWQVTQYKLGFTDFRDDTGELVNPTDINLWLVYGGTSYIVPNGEGVGTFDFIITSPMQTPLLTFSLGHTGSLQTYNLTITRSSRWQNRWGMSSVNVNYYVFSNSSITGTAVESSKTAGLYNLTFDTSRTTVGTQIIKVSGSQDNFQEATFDLTFNIERIYTRVNGTTYLYRNSGIRKTEAWFFYFNYTDVYNLVGGQPVGITGAIATFDLGYYTLEDPNAELPVWTDTGMLTDLGNGIYELDYDTENLEVGIYIFAIKLSVATDVYEPRTANLNLRIDLIPSQLTTLTSLVQTKTQRDNATYSFLLTDGRTEFSGVTYPANLTEVAVAFTPSSPTFNQAFIFWKNGTNNGIFNLTIDTRSIEPGTYTLYVIFSRINYTDSTASMTLTVNRFQPSITLPSAVVSVTEGQNAILDLEVKDTLPQLEQTFEGILISWQVEGTSLSGQITTVNADGTYQIVFSTASLVPDANYRVLITVTVIVGGVNYTYAGTLAVNVQVKFEEILGIPRPYFWGMVIAIAVAVGGFVSYRYVKYKRIPIFIRDIRSTRTIIKKGRPLGRESITESRGESISKSLDTRYMSLGLTATDKFAPQDAAPKEKTGVERKPEEEVT